MMEIPIGKGCFDGRTDEICCPFYEPDGFCQRFDVFTDSSKKRLPACLAAYPNGAVITITAKRSPSEREVEETLAEEIMLAHPYYAKVFGICHDEGPIEIKPKEVHV
jgi:hypothetical protein